MESKDCHKLHSFAAGSGPGPQPEDAPFSLGNLRRCLGGGRRGPTIVVLSRRGHRPGLPAYLGPRPSGKIKGVVNWEVSLLGKGKLP